MVGRPGNPRSNGPNPAETLELANRLPSRVLQSWAVGLVETGSVGPVDCGPGPECPVPRPGPGGITAAGPDSRPAFRPDHGLTVGRTHPESVAARSPWPRPVHPPPR